MSKRLVRNHWEGKLENGKFAPPPPTPDRVTVFVRKLFVPHLHHG